MRRRREAVDLVEFLMVIPRCSEPCARSDRQRIPGRTRRIFLLRRKVRGFVRSVFPGNAEEEAGFPEGAVLCPLAGLLTHLIDGFPVFVSGFFTIAFEGRFFGASDLQNYA